MNIKFKIGDIIKLVSYDKKTRFWIKVKSVKKKKSIGVVYNKLFVNYLNIGDQIRFNNKIVVEKYHPNNNSNFY